MSTFSVGSEVVLSESVRRVCTDSEKYQIGTVVRVGSWKIYDVQWNGIAWPISMREDELTAAE